MTLELPDPSPVSSNPADEPAIQVQEPLTRESVQEARRVTAALERVREQLLATQRELDRFIGEAQGRLAT